MVRELGIAARLSVEGRSRLWLLAALVFVGFRAATELTYPIYRDQAAYCMIGQSLLEGKVLYRDLWDNKPPGIFYLYAVIVKLFGPVMWSVGVVDLLCLFAISFFIFRFTKQYLGTTPAVVAVVFNTTWHVQGGNLYAAQPETFVVLFVFASYFLMANKDGWAVFRNVGAGLLLAAAFLVKYNALAFLPLVTVAPYLDRAKADAEPRRVGLRIPWREWLPRTGVLVSSFLVAVVLALALFLISGSWESLKEIQFEVLPRYAAEVFRAVPLYWVWVLEQTTFTLGSWTEAVAAAALLIAWKQRELGRCAPIFLACALSYASVTMQVRFHDYYFQTCLPFFAMLWGYVLEKAYGGIRALLRKFAERRWQLARVLVWVLVANVIYWPVPAQVAALAVDSAALRDWWRDRNLFYATSPWSRPIDHFGDQLRVIEYVKKHSTAQDGIFVWGTDPLIYFLAERRPPTRFVTNLGLVSPWSPPSWHDELLHDLRSRPPRYIIVARNDQVYFITLTEQDSEQYLRSFPALAEYISRNYRPVKDFVNFVVYSRREPGPGAP